MKTEILTITDRSGSMASIRNDVIGGYNQFLKDQKAGEGEARITSVQFDNEYNVLYTALPISEAPELTDKTFVPRGGTALYDAIGRTLNEQGKRIHDEDWADLVVVCIITDGEENSSHEYTSERIKQMTKHAEENNWKFIFLAANQDAFKAGEAIGMARMSMSYDANAAGAAMAYASTSATVNALRRGDVVNSVIKTDEVKL